MIDFSPYIMGEMEMNHDIAFSAGPRSLWGSLTWTVEIRIRADQSSVIIFRSKDGTMEDRTSTSIPDLCEQLILFADKHDISVFDRKIAFFVSEYLNDAGLDVSTFDVLYSLQRKREAEKAEPKEEEDDLGFETGGIESVWGSLVWTLEMKIKADEKNAISPTIIVLFKNTQTGEVYKAMVKGLRAIATNYREFFEKAGLAMHERRLSTMLSEYVTKIGLKASFSEFLDFLKEPEDAIEFELMEIPEEEMIFKLEDPFFTPGTRPKIQRTKIKEAISRDELLNVLGRLLDKASPEQNLKIETTTKFTINGEEKETSIQSDASAGGEIGSYTKTTNLENTFESPMKDIEIIDVLPFDLELAKYTTDSDVTPVEDLKDKGLTLLWSIPELDVGHKFSVKYQFMRRITRAMVVNHGDTTETLTTYHSIEEKEKGLNQFFESKILFVNSIQDQISPLLVRDIVPREFILADIDTSKSFTQELEPLIKRDPDIGSHIEWNIQDLPIDATLSSNYKLQAHPYALLSRGTVELEKRGKFFFSRIAQPLIESKEWIISHSVEYEGQSAENIEIIENIPIDTKVLESLSSDPNFERQTWSVREEDQKAIVSSFICYPYERSTLSYKIRGETDFNPHQSIEISLSEKQTLTYSSDFVSRRETFFSPPPEHLQLLHFKPIFKPPVEKDKDKKTTDRARILTGIFPSESDL